MRVCNVEKIDNGFIVQAVVTEEMEAARLEGIRVTQNPLEAVAYVAELLGVQVQLGGAAPVAPPQAPPAAPPVAPPQGGGTTIPFPGTQPPAAPPQAPEAPKGSYDEEIDRIVAHNDRKTAHARLKAHVDAGVIQDYNQRFGIEKLAQMLVEADKQAELLKNQQPPAQAPATPPAVPPQVPAASGPVVLKDLTDALQRLAATDPAEGPKKAFAIMQGYGAAKASDIPADKWPEAIAAANLQAGV